MEDYEEAYRLAKFEIKASKWHFLISFTLYILIGLSIVSSLDEYLDNGFFSPDFFFILLSTAMPAWIRPKDFQMKNINEDMIAAPSVMMLKMLPVTESVLIKSRFFIYYVLALPVLAFFLIMIYAISPDLQNMLSPVSFIAFSIIWLAFNVYIGGIFPASESGDKAGIAIIILYGVMLLVTFAGVLLGFHLITGQGPLYWTIIAAQKWPLLSSVISILLAFTGVKYWSSYMKKQMRKMDYL